MNEFLLKISQKKNKKKTIHEKIIFCIKKWSVEEARPRLITSNNKLNSRIQRNTP